jgi:hypothetical protein
MKYRISVRPEPSARWLIYYRPPGLFFRAEERKRMASLPFKRKGGVTLPMYERRIHSPTFSDKMVNCRLLLGYCLE